MNPKNINSLFYKILSERTKRMVKVGSTEITLFYSSKDKTVNEITRYLQTGYTAVSQFFSFQLPPFELVLLYSRQEMDECIGEKTPPWLAGQAKFANTICLFSPSVIEKITPHKKQEFATLICHEMVHLFIRQVNKSFVPRWLEEGLAYFLAGQKIKEPVDFQFISNPLLPFHLDTEKQWAKAIPHGAYAIAFLLVNFLIKRFGRGKVLKLLTSLKGKYSKKAFCQEFARIYKLELKKITAEFLKDLNSMKGGEQHVS